MRCFLRQLVWLVVVSPSSKCLDWLLHACLAIWTMDSFSKEEWKKTFGRHMLLYFVEPTTQLIVGYTIIVEIAKKKNCRKSNYNMPLILKPIYSFTDVKV